MNRLALIPSLGALLALPGCIVTHGLGATAEDTSDGSAEGSSDGSAEGSGTGADGDTEPDPSATSGQPGTTDASTGETGQVPETDGEPADCELDPDYTQWLFNGASFTPLAGIQPTFVAILTGDCEVGEIVEAVPEVGDPVWTVPLDCSLAGRIDADDQVAGQFQLELEMSSTVGYELVSSFGDEVRLKLVLDWWGMGWNGWLVLEHPDTGVQLLDLVSAEYEDPKRSTWSRQVTAVMPGQWRSTLSTVVFDAECGAVGECNDEPKVLLLDTSPGIGGLFLNEGQEGIFTNDELFLSYRASVTAARSNPMPTCTDTPLGHYVFAVWMQSQ